MWEIVIFFSKFSPEFGLNPDCNIEPVIAKSQVCDCKITSLWLRSHKSVTAKSQVCECKVTRLWLQSHRPVTAKSHACDCKVTKGWCQCSKIIKYAFHMIVVCVCVGPTELYVGISEVCQGQSSVWDFKGVVFNACDCMWQTKNGIFSVGVGSLGKHPGTLIKGDQPILGLPKHFPVWGLIN